MIYNIIDNDNNIIYSNFKVNKNASQKTILNKMKLELQKIFNYNEDIKTMISGKVDLTTGKQNLFYVCFGIKKNIRLEEV